MTRVFNLIRRLDKFLYDSLELLLFYPLLFIASLIVDRIEKFKEKKERRVI